MVVYDLGGGTLDVAVLRLERSSKTFLVMGTAGDPHLGGEDFDRALVRWLRKQLDSAAAVAAAETSESAATLSLLPDTPVANELALRAVERAKRMLSTHQEATLEVCRGRGGDGAAGETGECGEVGNVGDGVLTVEALEGITTAAATDGRRCARVVLTRAALATACASLLERALAPVELALHRAGGVHPSEIDDVVGGLCTSRIQSARLPIA